MEQLEISKGCPAKVTVQTEQGALYTSTAGINCSSCQLVIQLPEQCTSNFQNIAESRIRKFAEARRDQLCPLNAGKRVNYKIGQHA